MRKVVLFIIYDKDKKSFLSEVNPDDHPLYPNLTTFPGGKVRENEKLEETLLREIDEELGIKPIEFTKLGSPIKSFKGENLLHPFIVKKWEGEISQIVLDKNIPLIWEDEELILKSTVRDRPIIVKRFQKLML